MTTMTQGQAARVETARLVIDVGPYRAGSRVALQYCRSWLNRPRLFGGKLRHQFVVLGLASQNGGCIPARTPGLVNDSHLAGFLFKPAKMPEKPVDAGT